MKLEDPYFVENANSLRWSPDFNKEFIPPGTTGTPFEQAEEHGLITVRFDDDFWVAAALPWNEYKDKSIQEIVSEFWPELLDECEYKPDVTWGDQFGETNEV